MNGYGPPMADAQTTPAETPLKRAIGAKLLLVFVIGDVLGAGIYALVGEVSAEVGGAIWTAFTAALVLAGLTAFAYAELVTKYPMAAGSALYVNRAYDKPFFTFMVAFAVMCSGIASAATLSRAFAGRLLPGVPDREPGHRGAGLHRGRGAVNLRGISESVKVNMALTAVEVTGLLLIVSSASRRCSRVRPTSRATSSSARGRAWSVAWSAARRWPSTR